MNDERKSIFDLDKRHVAARRALMEKNSELLISICSSDKELVNAFDSLLMQLCNYYNYDDMAKILKELKCKTEYNPKQWEKQKKAQ